MTEREKTSIAKYYSARFNPKTSELDAKVVEIVKGLQEKGFKFKDIAQDAILRADGYTPEMFNDGQGDSRLLFQLEGMFTRFAEELLERIGQLPAGRIESTVSDEPEMDNTHFAKSFAKGFLQRQREGNK